MADSRLSSFTLVAILVPFRNYFSSTIKETNLIKKCLMLRSEEAGISSQRNIIIPWTIQIATELTIHHIVKEVTIMAMISLIMRAAIKGINHEVIMAASTVA